MTGADGVDSVTATEGDDIVINVNCACNSNGTDYTKSMNVADGADVTDSANGAEDADCFDGTDSVTCSDGAGGGIGADSTRDLYIAESRDDAEIEDCADEAGNDDNKYGFPRGHFSCRGLCKRCERRGRRICHRPRGWR